MKRFVVVGAGGVGGWLCAGLARMLEYKEPGSVLLIVDGDNFEEKNKERQSFTDMGNKAEARANELQPLFPSTIIAPVPKWVVGSIETTTEETDENDEETENDKILAADLIQSGDIVYAVVDNFAARKILFDEARKLDDVDVFTGGNDDELYGSIYHYRRREGVDITDHPEVMHDEFNNPPDRNPGELSCQERAEIEGGTQLLATNQAVSAYLLGRTHHAIFGEPDNLGATAEIFFDLGLGMAAAHDRSADPVTKKKVVTVTSATSTS